MLWFASFFKKFNIEVLKLWQNFLYFGNFFNNLHVKIEIVEIVPILLEPH
jgi:hypothetical protein